MLARRFPFLGFTPISGRSKVLKVLDYNRSRWASLVAQMVKNLPAAWETEVPGRLQSMGLQRVIHNCVTKHNAQVCG